MPHNLPWPGRRGLLLGLWGVAWASLVGALALLLGFALRLAAGPPGEETSRQAVTLPPAGDMAVGSVKQYGVVALGRDQGGFYALALTCPHLGCRPAWNPQAGRFLCPCHGSSFSQDGSLLQGPATRGLAHVALTKNPEGTLTAWPGRPVPATNRLTG